MAEEGINVLMLRMLMRMEQQRLGAKKRAEQQRRDEFLTPEKAQRKDKNNGGHTVGSIVVTEQRPYGSSISRHMINLVTGHTARATSTRSGINLKNPPPARESL